MKSAPIIAINTANLNTTRRTSLVCISFPFVEGSDEAT